MMSSESWNARPSDSPKRLEDVDVLGRRVRHHRAEPAGRRDQRARLAADHLEVVGLGLVEAPGGIDLADLSVAEHGDRLRQDAADLGAEVGADLGRAGEQVVAREDRDRVVPPDVRGGNAVAGLRLVDHVVVVQGRDVDELEGDRGGDQARVGRVAEVAGEEREHRAEALPAGGQEVVRGGGQQLRSRPPRAPCAAPPPRGRGASGPPPPGRRRAAPDRGSRAGSRTGLPHHPHHRSTEASSMMPTITPGNTPRRSVAAAGIARTAARCASAVMRRSWRRYPPLRREGAGAGSGSCMYISTITRR